MASRAVTGGILVVILVVVVPQLWKIYSNNLPSIIPLRAAIGGAALAWAALAQAATARRRHREQTDADRQRRITESFSKATEQLGSDKIEVRLGGIYTLERISRESPNDYWTVMETLAAFVRERARWKASDLDASETVARFYESKDQQSDQPDPPTDIAAVLTVIVRRPETERNREQERYWRFDFRGADLRGAILWGAHLERADLRGAHLERALLGGAHLEGTDLAGAHLEDAILIRAHLEGVGLSKTFGDAKTRLTDGFPRPGHWPPYEP
jgi:hypothetical protein